jgi:hypothetical protein
VPHASMHGMPTHGAGALTPDIPSPHWHTRSPPCPPCPPQPKILPLKSITLQKLEEMEVRGWWGWLCAGARMHVGGWQGGHAPCLATASRPCLHACLLCFTYPPAPTLPPTLLPQAKVAEVAKAQQAEQPRYGDAPTTAAEFYPGGAQQDQQDQAEW